MNKYESPITSLRFAEQDAQQLWQLFRQELGYGADAVLVSGAAADAAAVRRAISAALKDMGPGDLLTIYFAGHGTTHGQKQLLLCGNADLAWLDDYCGAVSLESVKSVVLQRRCHCLLLLDACRNVLRSDQRGMDEAGLRDLKAAASYGAAGADAVPDLAIYYGCKEGACSLEVEDAQHGLFSHALIQVIGGLSRTDGKCGSTMRSEGGSRMR